jgi:hypothetical protein
MLGFQNQYEIVTDGGHDIGMEESPTDSIVKIDIDL